MSEWPQLKVGDHINILSGFPFSSDHFHASEGTRLIRIRDLLDPEGDKIYYRGNFDARWLVKRGDVLIGMDGEFNVVRWRGEPSLLNQRMLKAEAKAQGAIDRDFFYYWCGPFLQKVEDQTAATTVKHLSVRDVNNAMVSAPPLPQQRQIAEILGTVDEVIEATEALIAKQQQVKAGLMHDLFTRGLTPAGELRPPRAEAPALYQETPLGWLPEAWTVSTVGREFSIESGITLGPHRRPRLSPYPYLRVANVHRDRIDLADVAQLEASRDEFEGLRLKSQDLLVVEGHANRFEIGRCAMVESEAEGMLFQNHLFRLRPLRIEAPFALLWLNSQFAQNYWDQKCSTSSGLNTINRTLLRALPVALPGIDEQAGIVERLFAHRAALAAETARLAKLREQKQGLMQALLTPPG